METPVDIVDRLRAFCDNNEKVKKFREIDAKTVTERQLAITLRRELDAKYEQWLLETKNMPEEETDALEKKTKAEHEQYVEQVWKDWYKIQISLEEDISKNIAKELRAAFPNDFRVHVFQMDRASFRVYESKDWNESTKTFRPEIYEGLLEQLKHHNVQKYDVVVLKYVHCDEYSTHRHLIFKGDDGLSGCCNYDDPGPKLTKECIQFWRTMGLTDHTAY